MKSPDKFLEELPEEISKEFLKGLLEKITKKQIKEFPAENLEQDPRERTSGRVLDGIFEKKNRIITSEIISIETSRRMFSGVFQ